MRNCPMSVNPSTLRHQTVRSRPQSGNYFPRTPYRQVLSLGLWRTNLSIGPVCDSFIHGHELETILTQGTARIIDYVRFLLLFGRHFEFFRNLSIADEGE